MEKYVIPLVPGPVRVPPEVLAAGSVDFGSGDLEEEFFSLYEKTGHQLKQLMGTENHVVIQTGEGMVALWSALKSTLQQGDRVLALATGIFGHGIGAMASAMGCQVKVVEYADNDTLRQPERIAAAVKEFRPKMITAVHCETPSGTLNPVAVAGRIKEEFNVPLLYVDAVASIGGTEVLADEWHIDLCLGGSQKCLSAPPGMAFLSVSPAAWEIAEKVAYQGYDSLLPFRHAWENRYFPYTPSWQGVAYLNRAAERILKEGMDACFDRHRQVADRCRKELQQLGLSLFVREDAVPAPTVTAVKVPEQMGWQELNRQLRKRGMAVGGSFGRLAGKVFRIGHMGSQADMELLHRGLKILGEVL